MNKQGTHFSAVMGHFMDCYQMISMKHRHPRSITKLRQLLGVRKRCASETFIETGTFLGNTAMRASFFFDKVITVEIDDALHQKAKAYLAKRKNIECLVGDALKVLPRILDRPDVIKTVIFLDGHFSGGVTGKGQDIEPACSEIELLSDYVNKIDGIVVDDFRTFTGKGGIPPKSELFLAIERVFGDGYRTDVRHDQVIVERLIR